MIDLGIVVAYFAVIFVIGLRARAKASVGPEEYFLSSRSLRWPSIAVSTIATNIEAGHFLSVAGAAYVGGLAQGNFELNAIFGIVIAAFFFVPLYLRLKVVTISQFFEHRFGPRVALAYALLMIVLYALLYLGTALFWAAFALDGIFSEMVAWISDSEAVRLAVLIVVLGTFSAVYTYLGGLRAVVRTDTAQFVLLLGGGLITVGIAVHQLGGWSELFGRTGDLMHLHLPRDHPTLPWTALFGMNLLNLNYWGANQVILQRALAAKSLRHAQVGLLVGGVLKYVTLLIIVIPGIAMAGIMADAPLDDPDTAYMILVTQFLPVGLRGLIVCGLFASLMSTVDSIFHSVSTLWSIDVYKRHLRPNASPIHPQPYGAWMEHLAHNLTDPVEGGLRTAAHLIHDRDPLYTRVFGEILTGGGVQPIRLPPKRPNLNASAERFVRSIKEECLSRVVPLGEAHVRQLVHEFVEQYHHERNHQGRDNQLLQRPPPPINPDADVERRERLGELLSCYYREAARGGC